MRGLRVFAALAAVTLLSGCGGREQSESLQFIAMDTSMAVTVSGKESSQVLAQIRKEVDRLEQLLDRTDPDSEVSRLNGAGGEAVPVGEELCGLLSMAEEYSAATGDAFDITLAPVSTAWGFTTDSYRLPGREELEALMAHTGMEHITLEGGTAALDPGTQIDLGAIGKGYASDKVAEILFAHEVERSSAALGGNVLAWGTRPDGQPWRVGVRDPGKPEDPNACLGILELEDAYAVTSGSYERFFEQDGTRYHHILDPATGYPADSGLVSVTIVADSRTEDGALAKNGAMCDALSTALFVMGEEKAVSFWRSGAYDFDAVLVTADGRVVVTEGLSDRFTLEGDGYAYQSVS